MNKFTLASELARLSGMNYQKIIRIYDTSAIANMIAQLKSKNVKVPAKQEARPMPKGVRSLSKFELASELAKKTKTKFQDVLKLSTQEIKKKLNPKPANYIVEYRSVMARENPVVRRAMYVSNTAALYNANQLQNGWERNYPNSEIPKSTRFAKTAPPSRLTGTLVNRRTRQAYQHKVLRYYGNKNQAIYVQIPSNIPQNNVQEALRQAVQLAPLSGHGEILYRALISYKKFNPIEYDVQPYDTLDTTELRTSDETIIDENGNDITACVPKAIIQHEIMSKVLYRSKKQVRTLVKNDKVALWKHIFNTDDINRPYTLAEIKEKLFIPYNLDVLIYDATGNTIYRNKDQGINTLVCKLSNGHLYPSLPKNSAFRYKLLTEKKEELLLNKENPQVKCKYCKQMFPAYQILINHQLTQHTDNVSNYPEINDITIYNSGQLMEIIAKLKGDIYAVKYSDGIISEFCHATEETSTKYICGDSIPSDIQYKMQNILDSLLNYKSSLNKQTKKVFSDIPHHLIKVFENPDSNDVYQCDKQKSYVSVLCNYAMPKYSKLDTIQQYDKLHHDCGFYYVETNDQTLNDHGIQSGWLAIPFVNQLTQWGYKVEIKLQLIPSERVNMWPAIQQIKEQFEVKQFNKVIGCFRHNDKQKLSYGICEDPAEALYFERESGFYPQTIYQDEQVSKFLVASSTELEFDFTAVPIYAYCVQMTSLYLLDMFRQVPRSAKILSYKTDCITYQHTSQLDINNTLVQDNNDNFTKYVTTKLDDYHSPFNVCKKPVTFSFNVDEVHEYSQPVIYECDKTPEIDMQNIPSMMINGLPGAGKSTMIRQICESLDAQNLTYKIVTPTNMSAIQFENATTLNKGFVLGLEDDKTSSKFNKFSTLNYLIIDEYGFVPLKAWNYIIMLAQRFNLKLIIVGDYRQHTYITSESEVKHDLYTNSVIRSLVNVVYNLNYSHRIQNKEFVEYICCNAEYDLEKLKQFGVNVVSELTDDYEYAICYYKRSCDEFNTKKTNLYMAAESKCAIGLVKNAHYRLVSGKRVKTPIYVDELQPKYKACDTRQWYFIPDEKISQANLQTIPYALAFNDKGESLFVKGAACTSHKFQGVTLEDKVVIFDWHGKHSGRAYKLVSLTRTREPSHITIYVPEHTYEVEECEHVPSDDYWNSI